MSFLKVKRKCEEDPKEIFVLACKKYKLQEICDEVPIFELASSAVEEKDIKDIIIQTVKDRATKSYETNLEKIRTQMRKDSKERNKSNRYLLWTTPRKIEDSTLEKSVPIIDVIDGAEKDVNQNEYVYDLYYSSCNVDINDPNFTNNHCLHELASGKEWDCQFESEDEVFEDEDDSNDENNWRNDYPDEEENTEEESDEEYLSKKLKKTHVSSDYSLSSDEEDDKDNSFDYYDEVISDLSDE